MCSFIDGGQGQVAAVLPVLQALGFDSLCVVGVSKGADRRAGQERLHRAAQAMRRRRSAADSPALRLIQRVRDEAHRFAITGHRRKRARRYQESVLETVPDSVRRNAASCCGTSVVCRAYCARARQTSRSAKESARGWRRPFMITCIPAREACGCRSWSGLPNLYSLGCASSPIPPWWCCSICLTTGADPAAGLLFAAAAITDSLDWLLCAPQWASPRRLGAFLDPVADKLIVAVGAGAAASDKDSQRAE
jgi:hypothetical protein